MMYGFPWIYAVGRLKIISCGISGLGLDSFFQERERFL
jgi:hypothetical protein